jgi:hypothetical protein
MQIKSCPPFSNSNPQLKPAGMIMSAIARHRMKGCELIADNLSKAGWSWGWVSAVDSTGERSGLLTLIAATESALLCAPTKSSAFADYAQNRACFRSGEIRVLDSTGKLERTIAFSEADRRL